MDALYHSERLSHAYIVRGKHAEILAMAAVCAGSSSRPCYSCLHCMKALRGIHPDIITVNRVENKKEIYVDQVRELKREAIRVPGEASAKVFIVNEADTMNIMAQNAFLQILEEPPEHTVFVLRTDNPKALLPTVLSRCVELKVKADKLEDRDGTDAAAVGLASDFFAAIKSGNEDLVRLMFKLEKLGKDEFASFVSCAHEQAALSSQQEQREGTDSTQALTIERIDRALLKAGEMLGANISTGHISGMLCSVFMK